MSQLMKILERHALSRDTFNNWRIDTVGLLDHKKLGEYYLYNASTGTNTVLKQVFLNVTYNGEQVGYITIEDDYYDPAINKRVHNTLFKYIDSVYATGALAGYNTKNKTGFTWHDLFEDDWDRFTTDGGGLSFPEEPDSSGFPSLLTGSLSHEIKKCIMLIKNKDHQAIEKFTKSFNPVRKAYGAACLYVWQQIGEPLSMEEKQLLQMIRQSNEKIDYSNGCLVERQKSIHAILTKRELDYIVLIVKRVI